MTLEIIGAGMGRTGTDSLREALEILGMGPCHHMFEITRNPSQLSNWQDLSHGQEVDWLSVFSGYRSQVDWPGARYWREIAANFPNAKVILTIRDPLEWYQSMLSTIIPKIEQRDLVENRQERSRLEMAHKTVFEGVFSNRIRDKEFAIAKFNEHISEVITEIDASRLLVFDVSNGWSNLCEFLKIQIPDKPFPRRNSSKEFTGG